MTSSDVATLAQQLRVDSVRAADAAGSGHPTSSMSAADLMAVLLGRHLRYDFERPDHPGNDHFILSKGHASPLLYAAYKAAGALTDEELLTFREEGSRLQGHPTPRHCPGWRPPRDRSDRGSPSASASRCPANGSNASHTAPGCCAATASSPRAPSGRRPSTPGTSTSTTSP
ncbi:hypothetical protein SALBM135S_06345 [Streptomyces alboniger]